MNSSLSNKVHHNARSDMFLYLDVATSEFLRNHFLQKDSEQIPDKQLFFFGIFPEDVGEVRYYKVGVNFEEN